MIVLFELRTYNFSDLDQTKETLGPSKIHEANCLRCPPRLASQERLDCETIKCTRTLHNN